MTGSYVPKQSPEQPSVAIFSSFRRFLGPVAEARSIFMQYGIHVPNPPNLQVTNPGAEFVRFVGDDSKLLDHEIQSMVMAKALASSAIYVVCPGGYTGRTATYEIGRAVEAAAPLYFSEMPEEPRMQLPAAGRIVGAHVLAGMILEGTTSRISH